jgi:rsbT antagonist protein RsbS
MDGATQVPRVTMSLMQGCLVATIQLELDRAVLARFRKDLLARLDATRTRQVILDCSGIEVMDAEDFAALRRTVAMASLMGAKTVLAGLQPGVVSALVDLGADLDGLPTALSLDDAFRRFREDGAGPAPAESEGEDDDPPE